MIISDVIFSLADDVRVSLVRRDGYAVCHVMDSTAGKMKDDYPWNVVAWGKKVIDVENTDRGVYLFV